MAHTPDGMKRFARTIPTKRDGTCEYCGSPTRAGVDFAGVNSESKWTSVCHVCAQSITEQVKGVVRTMGAMGEVDVDTSSIDMTVLPTVLAGQADEAAAFDMLLRLTAVRAAMRAAVANQARAAAPADPLIDGLRAIAASPNAQPRDREFAASLVAGFDKWGTLTERQRAAGQRMWDRLNTEAPTATALPVLENGLYLNTTTDRVFKLYTTQNGHQGCKRLEVYASHGSLVYLKGGVKLVREMVAAGEARLLTQDEATAFGKLHGFCINCTIDIDDDRSLAVGYGPVCAKHYGWFYPSYHEAAKILNRPVRASNGRQYNPDGTITADGAPLPSKGDGRWICDKGSQHGADESSCDCGDI